jgi:hypothetical protein
MRIDSRASIAGVPALDVRRLLRTFDPGLSTESAQRVLGIGRDEASRLIRELEQRGLIQREGATKRWYWRNTIAGNAFALATAAPAMSRKSVDELLRRFLDRVREVNSSPDYLYEIERVDVFGSYLTEADRLNDLDLAIAIRPKHKDLKLHFEACQAQSHAAQAAGRNFGSFLAFLGWSEHKVWLYLKSRSRGLSLHRIDEPNRINAPSRAIFKAVGEPRAAGDAPQAARA